MRQLIQTLLSVLIFSFSLKAQTWSSNPVVNTYANCGNSGTVTCGFGNVLGNGVIRARLTSLNSTSATIQMNKCSGTFASSGTMFVKTSICQSTGIASVAYNAGTSSASITFSHGIAAGQSGTFYATITSASGDRYYAEPITITATPCVVPTGLYSSNISHGGFTANWNAMPGATSYNINYTTATGSYPGNTVNTSSNSISISNNIKGCENYKFQVQAVYGSCTSSFSGSSTLTTNIYPAPTGVVAQNITSNSVQINWNAVNGGYPAYQVQDCSGSTIYQTTTNLSYDNITGLSPNTTYSMRVLTKNQNSNTCFSSPSSCVTFTTLNTVPPVPTNLTAILQGTNDALLNWQQPTLTADYFKIYRSNTGSNGTYTLIYTTPNQAIGYTDIGLSTGTYYYKIEACNSVGCSSFSNVGGPVVINAQPSCNSCIAWTNQPSDVYSCNAQNYLCSQGIIVSNQNGNYNKDSAIRRRDLARICYLGLKQVGGVVMPSDSFPTPFNDMQVVGNLNVDYWLSAAKALSYLEYGDGKSSFDRNFFNFNPMNGIERKYAMKVFLEAFNIAPDNAGPSPFFDVPTTDDMYGYINKAFDIGIITGYTCGGNTCFDPWGKLTREEAFIILYKILTYATITKPTAAQLNNAQNYFIPNNLKLANLNNPLSMAQANFNHYEKTSFVLQGKGIPLEFTHSYNSATTELPDYYYNINNGFLANQNMAMLGRGWNHNYNNYVFYDPGYNLTDPVIGANGFSDPKYYIFWSDGSIDVYNAVTNAWETQGVYNTFNISGNTITITTKSKIKYEFFTITNPMSNFFWPSKISDRNNNEISYTYSAGASPNTRKISEITDMTTNRKLLFSYLQNAGLDYLSSVTETGLNRTIQFTYNANYQLSSYKNPNNNYTYYYYNASGPNTNNLLTDITLPKGNKIKAEYQSRKLKAVSTLNAANTVTSSSKVNWTPNYSAGQGLVNSTVADTNGVSTNYSFNTHGNIASASTPSTTINNIVYGSGNNLNKPTNITINGTNVTMIYDVKGNLLSITKAGIKDSFQYNTDNDMIYHRDGNGYVTTYGYVAPGNLQTITRPTGGGTITITRNSNGQPLTITNPSNIVTTLGYNANGNLNSISLPLGIQSSSVYDGASRLTSQSNALSQITTYTYDNNDNLKTITNPLNGITTLNYDDNDNNTQVINPKNETTTKAYSFAEDLLMSETFGPHVKTNTYYPDGKLHTHTKGNGNYTYTYDNEDRLISDGHTSYTYDINGNIATVTNNNGTINLYYDAHDRLDYYTDYYGNTVDYNYDNNHNVATITYPGNKTVTYTYDANNRCTQVQDWLSQQTKYYYLTDDRLDSVKNANGTSTKYLYDAAGRNTGLRNRKSNGTIINEYTFTLDALGNHTQEAMNEPALSAGLNTFASQTVSHNPMNFNRIQNTGATNFTHNNQGQITNRGADVYTFDVNDNLLTVTGSATATFSYDGAGNRRQKTLNGTTTTRYVLSILGMSQVLMETNTSNAPKNYYVYGPTGLISRIKPNNTTHYYHYDYRGSTIAITDATQTVTHTYSYDAFGNVLVANEPVGDQNTYRYVGQQGVQYETPTLTYMRARYADLSTGRFISEDPIWALNLYPYADNNPVMGVDPKGEDIIEVLKNTLLSEYVPDKPFWFVEKASSIALNKIASNSNKLLKGVNGALSTKAFVVIDITNEAFNPINSPSAGRNEFASNKAREKYIYHKNRSSTLEEFLNKNRSKMKVETILLFAKEISKHKSLANKYREVFYKIEFK